MIDLIIYIEIAIVVMFLLGQIIYKDKDNSSNILANLGLSLLLTTAGLFAVL